MIYVIGDKIIDEEYQLNDCRSSPEQNESLIYKIKDHTPRILPGGAENVYTILRNLTQCKFFTISESDLPIGFNLPKKKRYYYQDQLMFRLDVEQPNYGLSNVSLLANHLLSKVNACPSQPSIIIFSDYNKGVFTELKLSDFKTNAVTIVDPKTHPLSKWRGCTIFKPNASEALELSGLNIWEDQCDFFQRELACKAVVITRSERGVVGKIDSEYFFHIPENKSNIKNLVGAGDCFTAHLAFNLYNGKDIVASVIDAHSKSQLYIAKNR